MTNNNCRPAFTEHRVAGEGNWHQRAFDPTMESVGKILVTKVASLADATPEDLPVLHEVIDAEALDAFFQPRPDGTVRTADRSIFFTYAGYDVRIHSDGFIALYS